ncbi:MAG TPA: HAD family phosphatase [Trebonia sp.]|nr:HAD family phosphatase [Trebonia sp.]
MGATFGVGGGVIEGVVFDLDGVLVDSEPVWERVRRGFVADRGGRWPDDAQDRLMGMSTGEWAAYLAADFGIAGLTGPAVAEQVIAGMAGEYARHLPLLPGAVDAVRTLAARWPLAVASSSPRSLIETVLATAGLTSAFTAVVSTEEVPRGKPAPDVYLTAAERLGLRAQACAAIEDSSNGLRSAASAGLTVIAIPRPEYPPASDALASARLVLPSLNVLTPATIAGLS